MSEAQALSTNEVFLNQLPFTDLYIRIDQEAPSRYRPDITKIEKSKYRSGNFQVPEKFDEHIGHIRMMVEEHDSDEGTITYQGMRMRYVRMSSEGEDWAALRAVPLEIPTLENLGLYPGFVRRLRSLNGKKGLILVGGRTGDGKTTTCVSLLTHFLTQHGGMLYTLEEPPEYALQGAFSDKAFCLQYEIKQNDDWAIGAKSAMRSRPDYIFFGEIRTPEAAENLLKTLTSGHLVVATIHAGQVSDTIAALMQLAEHKLGKVARDNLADRLLAAIHQTMTADGPETKAIFPALLPEEEKRIFTKHVKDGNLDQLSNMVKFYPAQRSVEGKAQWAKEVEQQKKSK